MEPPPYSDATQAGFEIPARAGGEHDAGNPAIVNGTHALACSGHRLGLVAVEAQQEAVEMRKHLFRTSARPEFVEQLRRPLDWRRVDQILLFLRKRARLREQIALGVIPSRKRVEQRPVAIEYESLGICKTVHGNPPETIIALQ